MRETYLAFDGAPVYAIRVKILVDVGIFATALSDYFYNQNEQFPERLNKAKGAEILKDSLTNHGRQGLYSDGFFDSSFEEGEKYNGIFNLAEEWVKEKYPYLTSENIQI